jgi:hypothetical protein
LLVSPSSPASAARSRRRISGQAGSFASAESARPDARLAEGRGWRTRLPDFLTQVPAIRRRHLRLAANWCRGGRVARDLQRLDRNCSGTASFGPRLASASPIGWRAQCLRERQRRRNPLNQGSNDRRIDALRQRTASSTSGRRARPDTCHAAWLHWSRTRLAVAHTRQPLIYDDPSAVQDTGGRRHSLALQGNPFSVAASRTPAFDSCSLTTGSARAS